MVNFNITEEYGKAIIAALKFCAEDRMDAGHKNTPELKVIFDVQNVIEHHEGGLTKQQIEVLYNCLKEYIENHIDTEDSLKNIKNAEPIIARIKKNINICEEIISKLELMGITGIAIENIIDPDIIIGRNEPCPCGSGKKYKNCHGK